MEKKNQFPELLKISLYELNEWRTKGFLPYELKDVSRPITKKQKRGHYTHIFIYTITKEPTSRFSDPAELVKKWCQLCEERLKTKKILFNELLKFGSKIMPAFWNEREFRFPPRLLEYQMKSQVNFSGNNLQIILNGRIDRLHMLPPDEILRILKIEGVSADIFDGVEIIDYKAREVSRDAHKNLRLKTSAAVYSLLYRLRFGKWPLRVTFLFLDGMVRVHFYPAQMNFFNIIFEPLRLIAQEVLNRPIERLCEYGEIEQLEKFFLDKKVAPQVDINKIPDIWDRAGLSGKAASTPKFEELSLFQ